MNNKQHNLYYIVLDRLKKFDCYVTNIGGYICEYNLERVAGTLSVNECVFISEYTVYKGSHRYMFKRLRKALDSIIYKEILCGERIRSN